MFPGGRFDLQIFERRYIDLIRHCLKSDSGFGICLLKGGEESLQGNTRQTIHRTGTYSKIVDWDQLENGLLGITAEGEVKFTIEDFWQADSGLLRANVEFRSVDNISAQVIPLNDQFNGLVDLLQSLGNHPLVEQKNLLINYDNLWDLGWRLSELIPIEVEKKQQLLEIDDPWERIKIIEGIVAGLANET
jgi:Lon protease-like protein|tara:strand:- start:1331 stop:1900 length:570 start_codon:yes stop_codon:yes gene_type:complete